MMRKINSQTGGISSETSRDIFYETENDSSFLRFKTLLFGSPGVEHVVEMFTMDGSIFFKNHDFGFTFKQLDTETGSVKIIPKYKNEIVASYADISDIENCDFCSPFLDALLAVKEAQELQFGVKDWQGEEKFCGWACSFALDSYAFWHFASPAHLGNKYGINPNLIDKIMSWVSASNPIKFSTVKLLESSKKVPVDYSLEPFGFIFLNPTEHFELTVEYLKQKNLPTPPSVFPTQNLKVGTGSGKGLKNFMNFFKSNKFSCLQVGTGYNNLGKLMITPRFVDLAVEIFPDATIEDIFKLRESYIQIESLEEALQ